jgi:AraC family transcriptional activator of pobA
MLREARRMLLYTSLSAAQIAYELGFSDPAHFSRVFTKGTGMPPRRFRTRLGEAD